MSTALLSLPTGSNFALNQKPRYLVSIVTIESRRSVVRVIASHWLVHESSKSNSASLKLELKVEVIDGYLSRYCGT